MVSGRVWTALGLGLVLALTLTVISCFSVSFKSGELKCNPEDMGRQCPVGGVCVQGRCYVAPDLFDSVARDAGVILDSGPSTD